MRREKQEWDWPPHRHYDTLDAPATGWASPAVTRAVGIYWTVVKTMVKMVIGAFLGLIIAGCVWLIINILSL